VFDDDVDGPRVRSLAAAGILGPVLFTIGFLVLGIVRRDQYDWISQQVSDLTAGPYRWAQQLNFAVFGLLLIALAAGLGRAVRQTRAGVVGPGILALNGVGLVLAGIFPLRENAAGAVYDPNGVHSVKGAIFFLGIGIALVALSVRLRADPRWRDLATYSSVTGIALVVLFFALGLLALRAGAPLHHWLGLLQRLVLAVWFPCIILLALRLRQVAMETERTFTATNDAVGGSPVGN
jgi:hypothetical membrane protein